MQPQPLYGDIRPMPNIPQQQQFPTKNYRTSPQIDNSTSHGRFSLKQIKEYLSD